MQIFNNVVLRTGHTIIGFMSYITVATSCNNCFNHAVFCLLWH